MGVEVQTLNDLQRQFAIERYVNKICAKVEQIEDNLFRDMQVLLFKTIPLSNKASKIEMHKKRASASDKAFYRTEILFRIARSLQSSASDGESQKSYRKA